jgi:hypothetical protein
VRNLASILAAYHRITLLPGKARKRSDALVESVQITTSLLQLAFETRYAVVVGVAAAKDRRSCSDIIRTGNRPGA